MVADCSQDIGLEVRNHFVVDILVVALQRIRHKEDKLVVVLHNLLVVHNLLQVIITLHQLVVHILEDISVEPLQTTHLALTNIHHDE